MVSVRTSALIDGNRSTSFVKRIVFVCPVLLALPIRLRHGHGSRNRELQLGADHDRSAHGPQVPRGKRRLMKTRAGRFIKATCVSLFFSGQSPRRAPRFFPSAAGPRVMKRRLWLGAAAVGQEERARTLPQADQRDVAQGAEADAGGREQFAQSQSSLRPAPTGVGTRQRGCPASGKRGRFLSRSSRQARQEEENRGGRPPKGVFISFLIYTHVHFI